MTTEAATMVKNDDLETETENGAKMISLAASGLPEYVWQRIPWPMPLVLTVLPYQPREKSKGGIILPSETKEYQEALNYKGRVLAIGSHCWKTPELGLIDHEPDGTARKVWPDWCCIGDWVIYANHAGMSTSIKYEDVTYKLRFVSHRDVKAIAPDPAALAVYIE